MLCLFHFTIITDKMCLFRSADLKGRRTSYILLNTGFHYGESHCRFKGWVSLSVYLLTYLFTYLSLMLIKKCPGTEKPPKTQWFVSMIHYPQRFNMILTWAYLVSISSHWYLLVCLLEELRLSNACHLTGFYQLWSQRSLTSPLIPKQTEISESFPQPLSFNNSQGGENCCPFYSKPWHTHHFRLGWYTLVQPAFSNVHTLKYAQSAFFALDLRIYM